MCVICVSFPSCINSLGKKRKVFNSSRPMASPVIPHLVLLLSVVRLCFLSFDSTDILVYKVVGV